MIIMIVAAGIKVDRFLTLVRNGFEYPLDDSVVIASDPHNPEFWVVRIRNISNVPAVYGVTFAGAGHNVHQQVGWGFGALTGDKRMGAIQLQEIKPMSDGATMTANVIIDPNMWIEFRGRITWANLSALPTLTLGPEIAGVTILEARTLSPTSGWPAPSATAPVPPTVI
jgi:hypothetical protein